MKKTEKTLVLAVGLGLLGFLLWRHWGLGKKDESQEVIRDMSLGTKDEPHEVIRYVGPGDTIVNDNKTGAPLITIDDVGENWEMFDKDLLPNFLL
jgi:hypothetical protein